MLIEPLLAASSTYAGSTAKAVARRFLSFCHKRFTPNSNLATGAFVSQNVDVTLTLNLPDEFAAYLPSKEEDLAAVLAAGLSHWRAQGSREFQGLSDVTEKLAELPSAEEVIAMRPSPQLADRTAELLDKNRGDGLTDDEKAEFEQLMRVEHIVRIAKAKAMAKIKAGGKAA